MGDGVTIFSSGHLTCWMPDGNMNMQSVTFLSGAEQRRAWVAAWSTLCGVNFDQIGGDGSSRVRSGDVDDFPGRRGTYEYVVNVVGSIRAGNS